MSFTQLVPPIPLRSPRASGEAIAVIDYGKEDDLLWVIIDDRTGQIWTVKNADVRAYKNVSIGRDTVDSLDAVAAVNEADDLLNVLAIWHLAAPAKLQRVLGACLTPKHVREALRMLGQDDPYKADHWPPDWLPDFGEG